MSYRACKALLTLAFFARHRLKKIATTLTTLLFWGIIFWSPALAINIVIHHDTGDDDNPVWDSDGALLISTFEAAAQIWEDLLPGSGQHDIDVKWDDDFTALAQWNLDFEPFSHNNIRVNPANPWYYDPTPFDSSEYDFTAKNASGTPRTFFSGTWFYRDLTATEQSAGFYGTPPGMLEVGYRGRATAGSPLLSQFDLLSTIIHELGHELGVNSVNLGPGWDFDPNWVGGVVGSGVRRSGGHLVTPSTLMCNGCGLMGTRRLPSATDVLAVAEHHGHTTVDLARKEFLAGSNWHTGTNWVGGTVPGPDDDAFIRNPDVLATLSLTSTGRAQNLFLGERAWLSTNAHSLNIGSLTGGTITIDGDNSNTTLFVNNNGNVQTGNLILQNQGTLDMRGGETIVFDQSITVSDSTSAIVGFGKVTLLGAETLINNGMIEPLGTLTLSAPFTGEFDLDGTSENGQLRVTQGNLIFETGGITDAFNGEITVGAGFFLRIDADWSVSTDAVLDLNGGSGPGNSARIVGGTVTISDGTIDVDDVGGDGLTDGKVEFDAPVEITGGTFSVGNNDTLDFDNTTTVENGTFTLASNATINFDGATTVDSADFDFAGAGEVVFNGPTTHSFNTQITSNGLVRQDGNATIIGSMTVNGGIFDLDGTGGSSTITLGNSTNPGSLVLNVDQIDSVDNTFNGTIETAEAGVIGAVTINLPKPTDSWTMAGTLNLSGGNLLFQPVKIAGSKMVVTGTVNVANNRVAIAADTDFNSTSMINTAGFNAELIMRGVTVVAAGASFGGLGTLVNDSGGDMTLLDDLDTAFVDLDNEGTLRLGSSTGQVEVNGFAQTSSGVWEVEVAGSLASDFDTLTVDATAELAGTITISLLDGFVPSIGQTFDILTAPFGVSGTFDTVLGGVDGMTRLGVLYDSTRVRLFATYSADFDLDGDVDSDDLTQWQGDFGGPGSDADGDGDTDSADYLAWQRQFGSGLPSLTSSQVVPEPTSTLLVLAGVLFIACMRRISGEPLME